MTLEVSEREIERGWEGEGEEGGGGGGGRGGRGERERREGGREREDSVFSLTTHPVNKA